MADTLKPQHLAGLDETDVAALANLCSRRRHPTPRERQLAGAIRGLFRDHWRARRAQLKASRTR